MAGPGANLLERELVVGGVRVFTRAIEGEGTPTVLVHGNPTHSEDWLPFLERLRGPAIALDLPGWGRSERPDVRHFDYSMQGLAEFFERFLDAAGIGAYRLVCHDWGVIALIAAQDHPERLNRIVVINGVPLLPGYRWHWLARFAWRRRFLGEAVNALATKPALRLISRQASATPGPMPDDFIDSAWRHTPRGTWPQALALYRSADPEELAAAGGRLERLRCPALVAWGLQDPYLPARFAPAYAERLPNSTLHEVDGAGHWPWLDRPEMVEFIVRFLES